MVRPGDVVEVHYDPAQRYHERPKAWHHRSVRLVFEDEALLVVDKGAGLLTVPTTKGERNTLARALERYVSWAASRPARVFVVHRLDRDASGLLVFGKTREAADRLKAQFAASKPDREYVALVAGRVPTSAGTFKSFLTTGKSLQRHSTARRGDGELAITHYRVESLLQDSSLVRVRLETGRRNQIRVHFAEAGHPVLGDTRYRPDLAQGKGWEAKRLALHAAVLGFTHPVTQETLRFESPVPKEFGHYVRRHKGGSSHEGNRV
jgi:23S rRNA pseudouridine1911/1915/1917 synthase